MDKETPARTGAPAPSEGQTETYVNALPSGSQLSEFEVKRVLGEGGFGVVYHAFDHSLHRNVAIKEYLPSAYAIRRGDYTIAVRSQQFKATFDAGLRSFIQEARLLAQFEHPALVKVLRFWEANGTAYMAMPLYQGLTLRDTLKTHPGFSTEAVLKSLVSPLFDAVTLLHEQQCFHRDISPDNIIIQPNGAPVLLDFGAARRIIGDMTQALTVVLKPGYAPIEQYVDDGGLLQGAWTDVYGFAAVLYAAITGKPPAAAVARGYKDTYVPLANDPPLGYSLQFLRGIDAGLAVRPEERPQSIAAFRELLGLASPIDPQSTVVIRPPSKAAAEDAPPPPRTAGGAEPSVQEPSAAPPRAERPQDRIADMPSAPPERVEPSLGRGALASPARPVRTGSGGKRMTHALIVGDDEEDSVLAPADPSDVARRRRPIGVIALVGLVAVAAAAWLMTRGKVETPLSPTTESRKVAASSAEPAPLPKGVSAQKSDNVPSTNAPQDQSAETVAPPTGATGAVTPPPVAAPSPPSVAVPSASESPVKAAAPPAPATESKPADTSAALKKEKANEEREKAKEQRQKDQMQREERAKDKAKEAASARPERVPASAPTEKAPDPNAKVAVAKDAAGTKVFSPQQDADSQRPQFRFDQDKSAGEADAAKGLSDDAKRYLSDANRGDATAQMLLARMYASGQGAPRSDAEAAKWYRKAADQGNAQAQTNLGTILAAGRGAPKDEAEAVKWYLKAAEQGNAQAQANLGIMYSKGQGIARDDGEAAKWSRKAAEQGNAVAQTNLGFMYSAGRGVPKDDAEAVRWYRRAAEQGNAVGQTYLANMYAAGLGVTKDDTEAIKWYRKAADQGYGDAAEKLKALEQASRK